MFAETLKVTVPLPAPLLGPMIEIQDAFVLVDHLHVETAVTEIELVSTPAAVKDTFRGVTDTSQSAGSTTLASCVTLTV